MAKEKRKQAKSKSSFMDHHQVSLPSAVISLQIEQNNPLISEAENAQGVSETENHQDANSRQFHFAGTRS